MNWIQGLYISILVLENNGRKVVAEVWPEQGETGVHWEWAVSVNGLVHEEGTGGEHKPAKERAEEIVRKLMEAAT